MRPEALLRRLLAGSFTNVAFDDARRLLEALGFDELRVRGSHHVYARPGITELLNLQDRGGQAKPYQLRQLMALFAATIFESRKTDERSRLSHQRVLEC